MLNSCIKLANMLLKPSDLLRCDFFSLEEILEKAVVDLVATTSKISVLDLLYIRWEFSVSLRISRLRLRLRSVSYRDLNDDDSS